MELKKKCKKLTNDLGDICNRTATPTAPNIVVIYYTFRMYTK